MQRLQIRGVRPIAGIITRLKRKAQKKKKQEQKTADRQKYIEYYETLPIDPHMIVLEARNSSHIGTKTRNTAAGIATIAPGNRLHNIHKCQPVMS